MPTERPNGYLTNSGVAEILHVDPKTVQRWAKQGKLPHTRTLGGHRRYREVEIREIADRLVFTPAAEGDPEEATPDPPFCDCDHSLYDHAIRPKQPAGECFVGGCKCSEFYVDTPFDGFRSGLAEGVE